MRTITLGDKTFQLHIEAARINRAVEELAVRINSDIQNSGTIFLPVLNGSFVFAADLMRRIKENIEVSFVKFSSYEGISSKGKITELIGLDYDLAGRNIVILEDIIDTGNTLEEVYRIVKRQNPLQIKVATLFFKPSVYKKDIPVDYVGLEIENDFIVGYGLDYNGFGRNLENVYKLIKE